jgi:N-acetylmuramoyl-L-alanine amidase
MRRAIAIISGIIIFGASLYFFTQSNLLIVLTSNLEGLNFESMTLNLIRNQAFIAGSRPNAPKAEDKVRILIVPGHEPDSGGTGFGDFNERDLTVELGQYLQQFLQSDGNYQTFITRNTESWNPDFADYFKDNWNNILAWVESSKNNKLSFALIGVPTPAPRVVHNKAPADVALRIYGINKWANENNIDLTIHIHLNNYPRRYKQFPGKYSGLVIYVPAQQFSNSTMTHKIADSMFKRLSMYNPVNDLPAESSGIIDDSELIAVGVNNTSDAASMLIEYDYIYQPQFINPVVRSLALKDLAYQTYLGLQDFFSKNSNVSAANSYNPSLLYKWTNSETDKYSNPSDIYALQAALDLAGVYPPSGKSKNDCPHSGIFGKCTLASLKEFQKKYGIIDEDGVAGEKTFSLLNVIYSRKAIE